jgi:exo-beta-1,3-glucanase (GH17 family)
MAGFTVQASVVVTITIFTPSREIKMPQNEQTDLPLLEKHRPFAFIKSHRYKTAPCLTMVFARLFRAIIVPVVLLLAGPSCSEASDTKIIDVIPDHMQLTGDVATKANTINKYTEPWLASLPNGSIILGVNPSSCNPTDWKGGTAIVEIHLPNLYSPTLYVIKLSSPTKNRKRLGSCYNNRSGSIFLDDLLIWESRTNKLTKTKEYYGAQHEPILTTIVVTESRNYRLKIKVAEHAAWELSKLELIQCPYPKAMKGVGYSPYRDCQYPDGKQEPSDDNISEDIFRLSQTCNAIRTYSATGVNGRIPAVAKSNGLQVYAGAWLDGDKEADKKELQALVELASKIDIDGLIVGNEYYLRNRTPADIDYLLQCIIQVKKGLKKKKIPITTAENSNLMFDWGDDAVNINHLYRAIIAEIDFVLVHIYPFWDGKPIEGAASLVAKRYKAIQNLVKKEYGKSTKRVVIGETGWPSSGPSQKQALPSLKNQKRYLQEFMTLAEQEKIDYLFFDAFDELWKSEYEGLVGQNWGYSYSDRTAKHNFYGVLIPPEQLPSLPPIEPLIQARVAGQVTEANTLPVYKDWPTIFKLESIIGASSSSTTKIKFVPSGFIGDVQNIDLFQCDRSDPHKGEMSSRITFPLSGNLGWGGIYWLPDGKWEGPGINILRMLRVPENSSIVVTFWARGENGGETVRFKVGGVGSGNDSIEFPVETEWIVLENVWKQYTIDLVDKDLSNVVGGFCWVADKRRNLGKRAIIFFLDSIEYKLR